MIDYITEFLRTTGEIVDSEHNAVLKYAHLTPVWAKAETKEDMELTETHNFLYDDTSIILHPGETFYEIVRLEVGEENRRKGYGTELVKKFFKDMNPEIVVLRAGILSEELYNSFEGNSELQSYIHQNIVPFWESVGFTDVNNTVFCLEQSVPMIWPKEKAEYARQLADYYHEQNEAEREGE